MDAEFVELTPQNYHGAFKIQSRCHYNPWSGKVFADCITPPYFAVQLSKASTVSGYYVGMNVAGEATLMDVGVAPELRGKGLGRRLLAHFIANCEQRTCTEIWLEVRASNDSAIHLYKQNGFELIETRKGYYPSADGREDALIMKKPLPSQ